VTGSAGVMAVVLAQTVAGSAAQVFLTPLWSEVKPGFFTLTGIVVAFSVLPAALAFLSLVPLARYPLSEAVVDAPVTPSKETRS